LKIDKPQTDQNHHYCERSKQRAGDAVAKSSESGETKNTKVSGRAGRCERNVSNRRVLTAQDFRAARDDGALHSSSGDVFNRQVKRIGETD